MSAFVRFLCLTLVASTLFLGGCLTSGPQKTLNEVAKALSENNSAAFLQHLDLALMAQNSIDGMIKDDSALSFLDDMTKRLPLQTNVSELLDRVLDVEKDMRTTYDHDVRSGILVSQCRASSESCPWRPEALRKAEVITINDTAAIARIPGQQESMPPSWLALQKRGEAWVIVGRHHQENGARAFAIATLKRP